MRCTYPLADLAATEALARELAPRLAPGDALALKGDLGAGKTAFARALIQAMVGAPVDVASPTFTLLQTYPVPTGELWHYDLYRIENEYALAELALDDATHHITLIEWPERLGNYRFPIAATLHFVLHDDGRREVTLETERNW